MGTGSRAPMRIQLLIWGAYFSFAPSASSARNRNLDIMTKRFCPTGYLHNGRERFVDIHQRKYVYFTI